MEVVAGCNLAVSYFLLTVIVYSSSYSGVFAVDDFTCVTKPRVPLNSEDTFIAGFFVNLTGSLSIVRTKNTYTTGTPANQPTDQTPPVGSTLDPTAVQGDVSVSVLRMPASGEISRIGVYACQATVTGGASTSIGTVIMSNEVDFLPTAISQTVNLGDAVRLEVTATDTSRTATRWRKDGSDPPDIKDSLYKDIQGASSTHAGTYEVHHAGTRGEGKQALMRLLVRGCQQDKWSASLCSENCPVCFNGGVCDDVGGLCICPPGFSGDICEIVLGTNRFGKDGSLRCDSGLLPGTNSCEGMLFCLPDPFGCICAAGYKGIDCDTECDDGTFGANCAQMCHCSGQATCDKATGRCPDSCASGFKGINCQDNCPAGLGGLNCLTPCEVPAVVSLFRDVAPLTFPTQIHLAWKFVSNLCAVKRYQVAYELTNRDQCQESTPQRVEVTSDLYADSLIISNDILPFSSYTVYIKASNEMGDGPETSISVTTGENVPTGQPENAVLSSGQTNSLYFTWDPIPCGFRQGYTIYYYKLQQKDVSSNVLMGTVLSQAVTLPGLLPCTDYVFQVAGGTSAGQGSYSTSVEASTTVQVPNPVEGLTVNSTMNAIQVSWPAFTGNAINPCTANSYTVTYELLNFDQCDLKDNPVTMNAGQVNTNTKTISGLEPYSSYKVYVRATNIAGDSSVVGDTVRTAEIAPKVAPVFNRSQSSIDSISMVWNPIPCGSRGGEINGYLYSLRNTAGTTVAGELVMTESVTITGLFPCNRYTFSVQAYNGAGNGPWMTDYQVETNIAAPGSVRMLEATSMSDPTQVVVTWQEPNGECPVDDYTIEYELKNRDQCDDSVGSNAMQLDDVQSPRTITSLYPHSTYSIIIKAANSAGDGPQESIEVTTLGSAPSGPPRDIKSTVITNTTLYSSWDQPECGSRNGDITQYSYTLTNTADGTVIRSGNSLSTSLDLTDLVPFTNYTLSVTAVNTFGSGPVALITSQTDEGVPPAPNNINFPTTSSDQITVKWSRPSPPHGIIVSYEIRYWKTESETSSSAETVSITDDLQNDLQTKEITNLEGNKGYSIQLRAETVVGFGVWSDVEIALTVPGTPSKPQTLMVSSVTETSISLIWSRPLYPNGNIVKYEIGHRVVSKPYDSSFTFDPASPFETQEISDMSDLTGTVINLEPSTDYELQVYGINDADIVGDEASIRHFTAIATDLPPPEKPSLIGEDSTSTSIAIRLVATTTSKYITAYQIGVQMTNAVSRRSAPAFGHYRDDPSAYIAAELSDGLPNTFVVGDNKEYGNYLNAPLQEGAVYDIYVGAVSRIDETEANVVWNEDPFTIEVDGDYAAQDSTNTTAGIAVGVSLSLLLVVVLILLAEVFRRRRKQHSGKENGFRMSLTPHVNPSVEGKSDGELLASVSVPMTTTTTDEDKPKPKQKPTSKPKKPVFRPSEPVPMSGLADYIKRNKSSHSGFQHDFESLPDEPLHPWTVAEKEENKKRNRYINIIAYDHSRVVLECLDGDPSSDYINACYIHGFQQDSKYIACQGPNKASVIDIWRMVWQERVGKIVMLTNLVENGKKKCEKYWPDGTSTYADISVAKVSENSYTNHIVRKFHLSKSSEPEGEYREVLQYHYTTWPDMKPPESSSLLQFVRRVQASETTQHGPIVVHCSAGVGRTGTYITVDSMLEQVQAEEQVDVLNFVRAMREQRFRMVQTLDQYKFIFDALLESCLSENTAIPIAKLHQDYSRLKKRDPKTGSSGIQDQFHMLEIFTVTPNEDKCLGGKMSDNIDKNRFQENLPVDKCRPYLMTSGEEGSTNYINATFLDGFKDKNAYLATQAPLPNTVGDIWRMAWDYKSSCIVMLNAIDEDLSVAQYWPDEGSVSFGPLTITPDGIYSQNDSVVVRHFSIYNSDRKNDESRNICHIQFLQWPRGKDIPNSPSSLLKVLEAVKMWTQEHPGGPITVHCIDGLGRSGTFCALMTILENIREAQVLDVFQAVKKLRATRAGMVQSLAQYQLCYRVAQDYLDSNSIYENLK